MKLLILLFFKFALFTLYKELSHKSELIFLNESNTKQKLQMTEQWMLIDPKSALQKMSSCKQNWLPVEKKSCKVNLE